MRLSCSQRGADNEDRKRDSDQDSGPVIRSVTDPELIPSRPMVDRANEDDGEDVPDYAKRRPCDPAEGDQPPTAAAPLRAPEPSGNATAEQEERPREERTEIGAGKQAVAMCARRARDL